MSKVKINIEYPLMERKQVNAIEYLQARKMYKYIADILYYDEMKFMKNLRNSSKKMIE